MKQFILAGAIALTIGSCGNKEAGADGSIPDTAKSTVEIINAPGNSTDTSSMPQHPSAADSMRGNIGSDTAGSKRNPAQ